MAFEGVGIDIERTCEVWFDHVRKDITFAMSHAWYKHGEPTTDPVRGATTLAEECGEVAKEALDATRKVYASGTEQHDAIVRMRRELSQTAGYAILLMCQLEGVERRGNPSGT